MSYSQLRQTQAELDEQARAQRPPGHVPSNIASLKVEQARAPEPQQAAPKPEPTLADLLPQGRNFTHAEAIQFHQKTGNWKTDDDVKRFEQKQAALTPNAQLRELETLTIDARKRVQEQRAQTMQPAEIQQIYRSIGQAEKADQLPQKMREHEAIGGEKAREQYRIDSAKHAMKLQERFERMPPAQQLENIARQQNQPYVMTAEKQREIERSYAKAPEPQRDNGRAARDARVQAAQQAINAEALTRKIDHDHTRGPKR
jgi:hypothetical protein